MAITNETLAAVALPPDMAADGNDYFALKVQGDSMRDALVADGDIVVMKRCDHVVNGAMAAVYRPSLGGMQLRHVYVEDGQVRLACGNPALPVELCDPADVQVHGRVMLVNRRLS